GGTGEVLHLQHRHRGVDHLVEDDEVDVDGGVVLRDGRLLGDLQVLLPEVDPDRPVDDREDEPGARPAQANRPPQPEQHDALVLPHHLECLGEDREHDQDQDGEDDQAVHTLPPSGKTSRVRPRTAMIRTGVPAGTGSPTDSADQDSPRTRTRPRGSSAVSATPCAPISVCGPARRGVFLAASIARRRQVLATPTATGRVKSSGGEILALGTDGLNSRSPRRTNTTMPPTVRTPLALALRSSTKTTAATS